MNLDTSIPLQARTPDPIDPLGALSKVLTLKNQRTEGQIRDAQLQQAQQGQADTKAIDTAFAGSADRATILAGVPGHLKAHVQAVFKQADEDDAKVKKAKQEAETAETDYVAGLAAGVKPFVSLSPEQGMAAVKTALDLAKSHGHEGTDELWQQIQAHPDALPQIIDGLMLKSSKYAGQIKPPKGDYTLGETRYSGETNKAIIAAPPKAEKPATPGSFDDYVTKYATERRLKPGQLSTKDIEIARKAYQQSDDRPRVTVNTGSESDVKDTIAGMKDGTLPPLMPGRASKEYVALMAEAKRQGYDLAGAVTDWTATQKHIATLNGAQQTRLNQAINSLPDMLDSVDALASKWKGGRFPTLNKANLALAKGGAFGETVASIANQLDAQIADVTADLGNVYMGGNSPTDHALGLAGKSLKGEWSEKVLHDMVALAKKNVVIRRNSINSTGVQGASADNPYAAKPSEGPKPTGRFNPATGKVEPF